MSWICPRCDSRYPDSDGSRGDGCLDCTHIIAESDLYEVYGLLADATEAASMGDPNECARKAADAKKLVLDLSEQDEEVRA